MQLWITIKELAKNKFIPLVAGAIISLSLVGLLIFLFTSPNLTPLYSKLNAEDSTAITFKLQSMGINYANSDDGSQILVPSDKVSYLRMIMAKDGLPSNKSTVGYEIFDKSELIGASQFVNNINFVRALEGELARTIASLSSIESARVHLVIPRKDLFSRTGPTPSASLMLKISPGQILSKDEIKGIGYMLVTAVPELAPENITIIDQTGRPLKIHSDKGDGGDNDTVMMEYRNAIESKLQFSIEDLLAKYVGYGKVKALVSAEIDFDKEVISKEDYDPDRQVVRSNKAILELNTENQEEKDVSVANNITNYNSVKPKGNKPLRENSRSEDITNYEIAKTVSNKVLQWGRVQSLSVAVLVDGIYDKDAEGNIVYIERKQEELEKLKALIVASVGIDFARGDKVELMNLRFAEDFSEEKLRTNDVEIWSKMLKNSGSVIITIVLLIVVALLLFKPLIEELLRSRLVVPNKIVAANDINKMPGLKESVLQFDKNSKMEGNMRDIENSPSEDKEEADNISHPALLSRLNNAVKEDSDRAINVIYKWLDSEKK